MRPAIDDTANHSHGAELDLGAVIVSHANPPNLGLNSRTRATAASAEMIRQQVNQILQSPELRLVDDPRLVGLARQLLLRPDDAALADVFFRRIQERQAKIDACGDPFLSVYPARGTLSVNASQLRLLTLRTGDTLGVDPASLTRNVLISGPTGSGKSTFTRELAAQLVRFGICGIYFDRKREARGLLEHPLLCGNVTVLAETDLAWSLYQPAQGQKRRNVLGWTTELIAQVTGRLFAQRLLEELAEQLDGELFSDEGFALSVLIDRLRQMPVRGGWRASDLRESMLLALTHLRTYAGNVFEWRKSDQLPRLFEKPHLFVIELSSLPADMYSLMVTYPICWLYELRLRSLLPATMPVIFIVDDATTVVDARLDQQSQGGTGVIVEKAFMGRGLNIGMMIDIHAPGQTSPKLLKNAETHLFTGARGEDPRLLQTLLGLTPEQADYLRIMPLGEAVALVPSVFPRALLGSFGRGPTRIPLEDRCRESAREFMRGVALARPASPPSQPAPAVRPPTKSAVGVSAAAVANPPPANVVTPAPDLNLRILIALNEPMPPTLTALYQQQGLSRAEGVQVIGQLERQALICLHKLPSGKRGAPFGLTEITADGIRVLESHGLQSRLPSHTHGGFLHNVAAEALKRLARSKGATVEFEVDLSCVRVDVRWRESGGRCLYFQIGVSDPSREADALTRAWNVPSVRQGRLILVAITRHFADRAVQLVKQSSSDPALLKSLQIRLIGELIDSATALPTR